MSYWALGSYTRNYGLTSTVFMAAVGSSIIVLAACVIPTQGFQNRMFCGNVSISVINGQTLHIYLNLDGTGCNADK